MKLGYNHKDHSRNLLSKIYHRKAHLSSMPIPNDYYTKINQEIEVRATALEAYILTVLLMVQLTSHLNS